MVASDALPLESRRWPPRLERLLAQHAKIGTPATVIVVRALEQTGNLDELDQHAVDAHQRWHGTQRGEGVVAYFDLHVG